MSRLAFASLLLLLLPACGDSSPSADAHSAIDGASVDAAVIDVAASVDAVPGSDGAGDDAGGAGAACGGFAGTACLAGFFCDFGANDCGGTDDIGTCQAMPTACPTGLDAGVADQVCGCGNQIYDSVCAANLAGNDVSAQGFCTPPVGSFVCGERFCRLADQYCERDVSDVVGWPDEYFCNSLPSSCGSAPDCACLSAVPCGPLCTAVSGGGLMVSCPGG